jgi:hypothetical protein
VDLDHHGTGQTNANPDYTTNRPQQKKAPAPAVNPKDTKQKCE